MEKPIMRVLKKAEKMQNKIVLPKICVEKFGNEYYLEMYKDHIRLIPIKKERE